MVYTITAYSIHIYHNCTFYRLTSMHEKQLQEWPKGLLNKLCSYIGAFTCTVNVNSIIRAVIQILIIQSSRTLMEWCFITITLKIGIKNRISIISFDSTICVSCMIKKCQIIAAVVYKSILICQLIWILNKFYSTMVWRCEIVSAIWLFNSIYVWTAKQWKTTRT